MWDKGSIKATYRDASKGTLLPGTVSIWLKERVVIDGVIIPKGTYQERSLNINGEEVSFDLLVLSGINWGVTVKSDGRGRESFTNIQVAKDQTVDLADFTPAEVF